MTFGQIEAEVRTLVNDTEQPYRFARADIWRYIVQAVRHLRNINPAEKYDLDTGLIDDTYPENLDPEVAESSPTIRIREVHEEAVIDYVAYLLYKQDMTDTVNFQISETLRTRAEALMQL